MELRGILRRAWEDVPNLLSLLVFFGVTWWIFRSLEFALVVTASLGFHELGHAAALTWYGLNWRITFGIVGAWTWSPLPDRERLSQFANVIIHLSGPLFSLLLALLAMGIQVAWKPGDQHLLILASFSAQVGFLNLLPFGALTDGGKIVRRMVSVVNGPHRKRLVIVPVVMTVLALGMYGLIEAPHLQGEDATPFLLGLLLIGAWMAGSMLIESRRAEYAGPREPGLGGTITGGQVAFMLLVMWDLLVLGLIVMDGTPFWLAAEYVLGILRNIFEIMQLVLVLRLML